MGQFGAFARVGRRAAPDAPHGPASGNQGLCDKVHTLGALEQPEITRDDARLRLWVPHSVFVVMRGRTRIIVLVLAVALRASGSTFIEASPL